MSDDTTHPRPTPERLTAEQRHETEELLADLRRMKADLEELLAEEHTRPPSLEGAATLEHGRATLKTARAAENVAELRLSGAPQNEIESACEEVVVALLVQRRFWARRPEPTKSPMHPGRSVRRGGDRDDIRRQSPAEKRGPPPPLPRLRTTNALTPALVVRVHEGCEVVS